MNKPLRAFAVALGLLTRLPVRLPEALAPADYGRSALFFPLVGAGIGAGLAALAWLLPPDALASAALILLAWVLITGALHLDGLADAADAWVGGIGDPDKTRAIMKDPHAGPAAVTAVFLVLLIKFAALADLLAAGAGAGLLWAPLMGRFALTALFATTPYANPVGMGARQARGLPRAWAFAVLGLTAALALADPAGRLALGATLILLGLLRRAFIKRLGGFTGDLAGAACELVECAALLALLLAGSASS